MEDKTLELVLDVKVKVTVQLGSCHLPMREVLELSPGTVIQLNQQASDPVGLYVNDKLWPTVRWWWWKTASASRSPNWWDPATPRHSFPLLPRFPRAADPQGSAFFCVANGLPAGDRDGR